jgi:hypothetical protein
MPACGFCLLVLTYPDFVCLFVCLFVCFVFVFQDRISLYSPGYPGTHFVDQAGLKLRNPPASASQMLGLKACATMPGLNYFSIALIKYHDQDNL